MAWLFSGVRLTISNNLVGGRAGGGSRQSEQLAFWGGVRALHRAKSMSLPPWAVGIRASARGRFSEDFSTASDRRALLASKGRGACPPQAHGNRSGLVVMDGYGTSGTKASGKCSISGSPGLRQHDRNHIETAWSVLQPFGAQIPARGFRQSPLLHSSHLFLRFFVGPVALRLDLDKDDGPGRAHDKIEFADRGCVTARQRL